MFPGTLESNIWAFIWWLSEFTGIGLGRFAPYVFGKMINRKGKRKENKK
jgi:hypothetical protein